MKKNLTIIKALFFGLVLLISSSSFSQTKKVTVFNREDSEPNNADKTLKTYNNLKFNIYLAARGVFAINYERVLTDKISIEGSAGITYRDYLYEFSTNLDKMANSTAKTGLAIEGDFRFYPNGNDNFTGAYLSPCISFRKYNLTEENDDFNGHKTNFDVGYSMFDLNLKVGYQYESYWFDDLTSDVYVGIGYRQVSGKELITGSTPVYNSVFKSLPQVLLGAKFGIPF